MNEPKKKFEHRLMDIIASLYGWDPVNEAGHVHPPLVFSAKHEDVEVVLEDAYPPTCNGGFAITFSDHGAWCITFDEEPILHNEDGGPHVKLKRNGVVDEEASFEDIPDEIIRAYLVAQARRYLDSAGRLLKKALSVT